MDFLVELMSLMSHLGLLTPMPESEPPQWVLPMRLPERNVARGAFASFLTKLEFSPQAGAEEL